ncbi:Ulp1 protease family, C-terminal catalytic domain [Sesbania bispinosa]|nr:Ulp1 protease family, C-terminal catalytic domain [Sesbania bispinosa]
MAGTRKPMRRKDPPRPSRRSPRNHGDTHQSKKSPRVEELIDISSSYGGSVKQEFEQTNSLSQNSSPSDEGQNGERFAKRGKVMNDEAGGQVSEEDKLKELVNCLASIIVNGTNICDTENAAGLSLLVTSCLSPNKSTVTNMADADTLLATFSPISERFSKSAPIMRSGASGNPKNLQDNAFVRKLFNTQEPQENYDHYINNKPIPTLKNEFIKRGVRIPHWMDVAFRPPVDLDLDDIEAVTATYIFLSNNAEGICGNEVLVKCSWGIGDRNTLKTLIPKTWIDQEILNILASKMTHCESKMTTNNNNWFLPTTFAQYVLQWGSKPDEMIERYKTKFMGMVDYLRKIFVPINDSNLHWYLMVIDFNNNKIVILDSLRCEMQNGRRKRYVKKLAMFIEEMLLDPSFYEKPNIEKPMITDFVIIEPHGLPQQLNGYDCGVWVAKWMSDYTWDDDYNSISVSE